MNKDEYQIQLQAVFNLAALIRGLKLTELLEAMGKAETLGPILDPTLYNKIEANLHHQKRLVQAARAFQRVVEELVQETKKRKVEL